jgi:uncharacterized OsmC-like protein
MGLRALVAQATSGPGGLRATGGNRQAQSGMGSGGPRHDSSLGPNLERPLVSAKTVDLKALQEPLKESYRADSQAARITLSARGREAAEGPVTCSIEVGRAIQEAQAHVGVGGPGTAACSGDLLLGALAACAQLTCQMVAASMGLETERIDVLVEGDLDLRGTLGLSREVSAGFEEIRLRFEVSAPKSSKPEIEKLIEKTERYCTVLQTLTNPPVVRAELTSERGE